MAPCSSPPCNRNSNEAVFAIVLNYCSLEDTLGCVSRVRASRGADVRVLVMDNASPDGSGLALARQLPADEFVQLKRNTGYAGGNNAGIRLAIARGARHVLVLNPDVRVGPKAVARYCEILAERPDVGALNSIQVGPDGETIDSGFRSGILTPLGYAGRRLRDNVFPPLFEAPRWLLGAALMLPVSTLERVGGFDPLFFAYGEEIDLCRRIRLHGLTLAITAEEPIVHLRTPRTHPSADRLAFLVLKGHLLYLAKDPAVPVSRALRTVFRQLLAALVGRPPGTYPFSRQTFTGPQIARAIAWFTAHGYQIRTHRLMDRAGRAYL
jgi:GT2 family glycosyltransferase